MDNDSKIAKIKQAVRNPATDRASESDSDEISGYDYDDWQPDVMTSLQMLASKLYIDYVLERDEKNRMFIYETSSDDSRVNILYRHWNAYSSTTYAFAHLGDVNPLRSLSSDVSISEYCELFTTNLDIRHMYFEVFKEMSRPMVFKSVIPKNSGDKYAEFLTIPDVVLYMAERMMEEGLSYRYDWRHYYCVSRSMFDRYKARHSGGQ